MNVKRSWLMSHILPAYVHSVFEEMSRASSLSGLISGVRSTEQSGSMSTSTSTVRVLFCCCLTGVTPDSCTDTCLDDWANPHPAPPTQSLPASGVSLHTGTGRKARRSRIGLDCIFNCMHQVRDSFLTSPMFHRVRTGGNEMRSSLRLPHRD